jgi:anti-sigma factor RsiW
VDVSDHGEHRDRWSDEIAAYALGVLDERAAALLEHHLAECDACTEELRWLQPAADAIPGSVEQMAPPPSLRKSLMETVTAEAAAAGVRPSDRPTGWRSWLPRFGDGFTLRPALAVTATVLLLVAGVAGYELRSGNSSSEPTSRSYSAQSDVNGSSASGTLEVSGDQGSLHVVNLPPTKRGEVYQAWVQEPAGSEGKSAIHPSSVFVVSEAGSGDVSIPKGLDDAARVMVTREPEGGSKLPSESPVLTAEIG